MCGRTAGMRRRDQYRGGVGGGAGGLSRRTFVTRLGKGAIAVAVFGPVAVACSDSGSDTPERAAAAATTGATGSAATTPPTAPTTTTTVAQLAAGIWERVNLGFVSAYVLARDGRAAVIDTGVAGSKDAIEGVLTALGLGWGAVDHVILTHLHGDHIGSLGPVMDAAGGADAYAGGFDIPGMGASPRPVTAVGDGDQVFGLEIVETPGHTAGHICVLDPVASVLVAGDAINGADGGVIGPNPDFSRDMTSANESVKKLAALQFETVLFGHGEPVIGGAGAAVAALAATL